MDLFGGDDLKSGILDEPDTFGFCLPGIIGEVSGYSDQIGNSGLIAMSRSIKEGRMMIAICAGAYFISRETYWQPKWGPSKFRSPTAAIFNSAAIGPHPEIADEHCLRLADITYKSPNGTWCKNKVAYGNGPVFYDYAKDNLEPLAYYQFSDEQPLAAGILQHGMGQVLMTGILPTIGWQEVRLVPGIEKTKEFADSLKPYEPGREDFMSTIKQRTQSQLIAYRQLSLAA